jgi:hypothetical protein
MATISELIHLIKLRRMADEPPYKLVLGSDIQNLVLNSEFSTGGIIDSFPGLSRDERFTLLSAHTAKLQGRKYLHLAHLIAAGYFDIVVTTDPTNELETALLRAGLGPGDFDVIILGYDMKIQNRLASRTPKVKIVKLRGDLLHRALDNFVPSDALKINEAYESQISSLIQPDSILLGLKNNDFDIFRYIRNTDGAIWIIQNTFPEPGGMLDAVCRSRLFTNLIIVPDRFPEKAFELLENDLGSQLETKNSSASAMERNNQASLTAKSLSIDEESSEQAPNPGLVFLKQPMKIFISYSHRDEEYKNDLITMLAGLERRGIIDIWQDGEIEEGDEWLKEIENAMNECDLALLFVSANFINSRFIQGSEVPRLLQRRKEEGLRVVPIIIDHCLWESEPVLSDLQAMPREAKPIITFPRENGERTRAWKEIAQAIEKRAKK